MNNPDPNNLPHNPKIRTIDERWREFNKVVIPASASQVQRKEMRLAFYAGFSDALAASMEIAELTGDDDDVGARLMAGLHEECQEFVRAVVAGRIR